MGRSRQAPGDGIRSCAGALRSFAQSGSIPRWGARGRSVSMTTTSGTRAGSAWTHARAFRSRCVFLSRPRCWLRFREPRAAPGSILGHGPRAQVLAVAADFAAAAVAAEPGAAGRPRRACRRERCPSAEPPVCGLPRI